MNSDFKELLQALNEREVKYLVVGGYAVIFHASPRFTEDLDIWIRPDKENAHRLMHAFSDFGMPLIDIEESDFAIQGTQYVVGMPPSAIDFLTTIPGIDFDDCWKDRVVDTTDGMPINYLSKVDLIASKKEANRLKDQVDLENLE